MRRLSKLPNKWQKNKTEQSPSLEISKDASILPPNQGSPSAVTYHRTCKTLPLEAFINAYCNNDLSGLIISNPNNEPTELQDIFNEILFEYSGLIKSENSGYIFTLSKEIAVLQHHIIYIDYATFYLELAYDEDIAQEVRNFGYTVPEITDPNYQHAIGLIRELAKRVVFDHGNLVDEYNRLSKTISGKKQTEDEFYSTVVMLSKHQGYDIFKVTVFVFTQVFNNYLREQKLTESQLEKYK